VDANLNLSAPIVTPQPSTVVNVVPSNSNHSNNINANPNAGKTAQTPVSKLTLAKEKKLVAELKKRYVVYTFRGSAHSLESKTRRIK
jgi:hypothetical protein